MGFARSTTRWYPNSVVVIDNILKDPMSARKWVLDQTFGEQEDATGWCTKGSRTFAGMLSSLRKHFGAAARFLDSEKYYPSGSAFISLSGGIRNEVPRVHWDEPENAYIAIVYLSPNLPVHFGTSLWEHRRTGLRRAPVRSDEANLGMSCEEIAEILERDSYFPSRWIEVDRIGYRFNRAVVYPAYALHSATNHRGTTMDNGRKYQFYAFRR